MIAIFFCQCFGELAVQTCVGFDASAQDARASWGRVPRGRREGPQYSRSCWMQRAAWPRRTAHRYSLCSQFPLTQAKRGHARVVATPLCRGTTTRVARLPWTCFFLPPGTPRARSIEYYFFVKPCIFWRNSLEFSAGRIDKFLRSQRPIFSCNGEPTPLTDPQDVFLCFGLCGYSAS